MRHLNVRRSLTLFVAVAALTAAGRMFGPPSITVTEVTGTPPTPGAVLQVNATHHTDAEDAAITGRAEGMQNGKRVSQPIALTKAAMKGRYGVTKQWENGSPWVLVFTVEQGDHGDFGSASSLVKVDARGKVVSIEALKQRNARGDQYGRKATEKDVADALASMQ